MTIYGYKCVDCGLENDFTFKMGEAPAEFTVRERVVHRFVRNITPSAIQVNGSSGDGYLLDSKTGWTSKPGLRVEPKRK